MEFDLPKGQSSIIKVIGMGGGGSNAVNFMYEQAIEAVDFIICNTDSQALSESPVPNKVHLGPNLTQGLGAGANPDIGRQATEESMEELRKILEVNTKMVFITAGMGGGTGTGGAPIVAKICKDLGILTVGIVTSPFSYEGKRRMKQAEEGIKNLKEHVDTLLVISNDKLRMQFGNLPFKAAFAKADNILATAAKCITDVINIHGVVNVDFADVSTAMKNGGVAILGSATAEGDHRAQEAINDALSSPLLNDSEIEGAQWILLNITSSEGEHEHTIDEMDTIQAYVQQMAGETCDVILGMGHDNTLEDKLGVTIIATGFQEKPIEQVLNEPKEAIKRKTQKIIMELGHKGEEEKLYAKGKTEQPNDGQEEDPMAPRLKQKEKNPSSDSENRQGQEEKKTYYELGASEGNTSTPDKNRSSDQRVDDQKKKTESYEKKEADDQKSAHEQKPKSDYGINFFFKGDEGHKEQETSKKEKKHSFFGRTSKSEKRPEDNPNIGHTVYPYPDYLKDRAQEEETKFNEASSNPNELNRGNNDAPSQSAKDSISEETSRMRQSQLNMNERGDPYELESVPAYIRRNIKLKEGHKPSEEENPFSGYQVKKKDNDKDQSEISTINTFLDGKKPD